MTFGEGLGQRLSRVNFLLDGRWNGWYGKMPVDFVLAPRYPPRESIIVIGPPYFRTGGRASPHWRDSQTFPCRCLLA